MFKTLRLLNKFYREEAAPGQFFHKFLTYSFNFFLQIGRVLIGKENIKYLTRHVFRLSDIILNLRLKDGIRIRHFLPHYSLLLAVISLDEYNLKTFPENRVAIDIGANIGIVSLLLAKRNHAAKVYAFEPEKKNFDLLVENLTKNKCNNVIAVKKALLDKKTKIKLLLKDSGTHTLFAKQGSHGFEWVEANKLDDEVKEKSIDLIKIDTEGSEQEILEGATKTLKVTKQVIVERVKRLDEKTLLALLKKAGFDVKKESEIDNLYFGAKA